jgi:uncharacterized oxidoreductase
VIAQGKARVALNKGEQLPEGYLIDDQGRPTTDPIYAVKAPLGALCTFGEHKGFGLALICEILGGALAGGMTTHSPPDGKRRIINGMLSIIFDPAKLADGSIFEHEMKAFIEWVKASPPQPGGEQVRIAGEPERETRAQRLAQGVPVDETTWNEMLETAKKLGLDAAQLQKLAGL